MKVKYVCVVLALFLVSCYLQPPDTLQDVKDVTDLPQDHTARLADVPADKVLLTRDSQTAMNEHYDKTFFSVWHHPEPVHALPERLSAIFTQFAAHPGYGENKRKHSTAWLKKLQQNAWLENYPNTLQPAITVRSTNLRMLPTNGPHFYKPGGDINGWPFDNLQISSVAANTPILICHISRDRSWALVETSFAFGWIPAEDFARVDDPFMQTWQTSRYATVTRDKIPIVDANGNFSLRTSIGQMFPLITEMADKLEILIASADANHQAIIQRVFISREIMNIKPLPFTYANATRIANELIDEPYGWGGLYGNRDCSAMTRDFFAPFGIWLPRHSADQAKKIGIYIDLEAMEPQEKEKVILEQGIPYLSLLWRRGHIMLYIGERNGRALIFHNVWGLRITDARGEEGRKIIGKAVITTLHPGKELTNIDPDALLIKNLSAMTILAPAK
ncbi:MAG TPA: NlpC/P60 family N-terminal domain-containing protein [Smithella sp.]|nr:SH3 domain-containing protein [Smithella sp.]NMC96873.1 hypothetical protein [Deltaproteobacteria bacterium]HOC61339.1 NlpC/P60 family N-terminal domain-containing protein [Smithellaceae bacterium]HNQ64612.1 NlpC/P60 family N-terminal domain-containing protein [Smithella sp.]HOE31928.1 NlpC/P60 family N-terminal domain-containing protein [Smithella sp.]